MTVEEALNVLKNVCSNFRGTWPEHQAIQQALAVVREKCVDKNETGN